MMKPSEKKPGRNKPELKKAGRPALKKSPTRNKPSDDQGREKSPRKSSLVKKRVLKKGTSQEERPVSRERSERPVSRERSERPVSRERSERPVSRERSERPVSRERSEKPVSRERSEKPVSRERSERPQRDERPKRPASRESGRPSPNKRTSSDRPVKQTFQREDQRNSLLPGIKPIRLNKYIANAGICSRRDADKLIQSGVIKVNGKPVTELGSKIYPGDHVQYNEQRLKGEALRYVLLNKPKGFICTMDDPQDRRTVMELVKNACSERIYPVGRLDRNTTGLLLLTNDGDLAKKLTHPRHRVKKVYNVELDKGLTKNDMVLLANGMELEDGFIAPDAVAYAEGGDDKKKVGIEIHSGRNRIVRRMFEKIGYDVVKLDRVCFANLTKKDLPRGKWRHLTLTEINILRRVQ